MASRQVHRLVGAALVCVLASPLMVVGQGTNTRDFPNNLLCPVNLGWAVDPVLGTADPPNVRPAVTSFVATGGDAEISLVSCDLGLTNDHPDPDGLNLFIRGFAVVRKDVYDTHQVGIPDTGGLQCYIADTVGSVFDRNSDPAVNPQSAKLPFFDDFSDLAFSQKKWRFNGAEIKEVLLSPAGADDFLGNALVLARFPTTNPSACSMATVRVRNLKKGQTYVIDYQWQSTRVLATGEVEMLTFIDTDPK